MGRPRRPWGACYDINPVTGCWLWKYPLNSGGYASYIGKMAHRYSYELYVRPIPEGLTIDHLCKVRHCVNPDHLEPCTYRENNLRSEGMSAKHARATHCPKGHAYSGSNLYVRPDGKGRGCRECRRKSNAKSNAKRAQPTLGE